MEIPSTDELVAKDKTELDKVKVILEIESFKEKQRNDRVRYRQETLRFFIIAVFSGLITFGSTYFQKDNERKFKKIDDQDIKLQDYILALEDNTITQQEKYNIICKISRLKVLSGADSSFVHAISTYEQKCEESRSIAQQIKVQSSTASTKSKAVDTTRTDVKASVAELDKSDRQEAKLQNDDYAKSEKGKKETQNIAKHTDTILVKAPAALQAASAASSVISNIVKQRIDLVPEKSTESIDKFYPVQWFKEGYSIQMGKINLTLLKLNKSQEKIVVKVCYTNSPFVCEKQLESQGELDGSNPLLFSNDDKKYELSLKSISHAGKNPFTLAAYVGLKESAK